MEGAGDSSRVRDAAGRDAGVRWAGLPDGRRIAYAEYGAAAGRPVLALHGAPACRLMFAFADEPARRLGLRLIAPDRPGCGLTPAEAAPRTVRRIAEDMVALADALRLETFGVIGISGGGPYAAATAALLGPRVFALALVSPVGPFELVEDPASVALGHRWFFFGLPRRRRSLEAGAKVAAAAFERAPVMFARLFAFVLGGADAVTLARREARELVIAMTREALRQGTGGPVADLLAYSRRWEVDLSRATAPATLWQDTVSDAIVPRAAALALAQALPNCKLVRIDGGGHFWALNHAQEVLEPFAAKLDRF